MPPTIRPDTTEVEQLRAENLRLAAELDARDRHVAAMRDPLRNAFPNAFSRPTREEIAALQRAVEINFTQFKPKTSEIAEIWVGLFRNAFIAVAHMPRHPENKLNMSLSNGIWQTRAEEILKGLNLYPNDVGLGALTAAVLAHNDIAHSYSANRWPHDLSFGFGNYHGRSPDGSAWRKLLDTRVFLPATAYPILGRMEKTYELPRPKIFVGGKESTEGYPRGW